MTQQKEIWLQPMKLCLKQMPISRNLTIFITWDGQKREEELYELHGAQNRLLSKEKQSVNKQYYQFNYN